MGDLPTDTLVLRCNAQCPHGFRHSTLIFEPLRAATRDVCRSCPLTGRTKNPWEKEAAAWAISVPPDRAGSEDPWELVPAWAISALPDRVGSRQPRQNRTAEISSSSARV